MSKHSLSKTLLAIVLVIALAAGAPIGAEAAGVVRGEALAPAGSSMLSPARLAPAAAGPSPRSSASPANLLFDGSSISDYGVESAPHAISEVPDPVGGGETVFKMTVANDDVYPITPTDNPRAQALSPAMIEPGDEFWLSTKFLIPKNFPFVSGWMSLVSIYGPPFEGPSPWQISVDQDEFRWMREEGRSIPWHVPLVEGQWQTVLLHERFGTDGFVEMWWNGEPITFFDPRRGGVKGESNVNPDHVTPTTHLELPTMDHSNDGGANSAKIMQYREAGMFNLASVYFGALKVGTSRAAVEG